MTEQSGINLEEDSPPAGFESHWDAPWLKVRSDECRRLASVVADQEHREALLALARDFKKQSDHAALLAAVAFGNRPPR